MRVEPCCGQWNWRWLWMNPADWKGDPQDVAPNAEWAVNCRECGCSGPLATTQKAAMEAYNATKRTGP